MAVPCGTSALDENSIRTSAHTKAKQYMENKPIKFAIRNITNVSTRDIYIHSFQENGQGNMLPSSQAK